MYDLASDNETPASVAGWRKMVETVAADPCVEHIMLYIYPSNPYSADDHSEGWTDVLNEVINGTRRPQSDLTRLASRLAAGLT
jgi:hypothetical protein